MSSPGQFKELVDAQKKFFRTGRTKDLTFRKEQLRHLRDAIVKHRNALAEAIHRDLRRPVELNAAMEVDGVLREIDHTLEHLDEWAAPEQKPDHPTGKPSLVKDPLGVILLLAPWNYPVMLTLRPLVSIIAAGNTAVIKPSEVAQHSADALDELLTETFPKEYVKVVQGGPDVANALLHERYDHIFYTGAPQIGKIIMAAAAKHLTPVTLELGGKCPVFVASDVDIAETAQRLTAGKWLNNGQTCLAPDYILVNESVKPKLVDAIAASIRTTFGDKIHESPQYSRVINQRHFDRLKSTFEASSAKPLFQGGELNRDDCFIPPVLLDASKDDAFMKDEIFGPFLPIVTVNDIEEAIDFINDGEKPLAAYLFTKDKENIAKFVRETSSGGVTINDVIKHVTVPGLPFGGVGTSGMGRYHGKYGFDTFTHEKSLLEMAI